MPGSTNSPQHWHNQEERKTDTVAMSLAQHAACSRYEFFKRLVNFRASNVMKLPQLSGLCDCRLPERVAVCMRMSGRDFNFGVFAEACVNAPRVVY